METKEYRTIDKSDWEPGVWMDEPDKMQFADEATGLPCLIVRNQGGALCGYVGVPESHPWHGKGYSDVIEASPEALSRTINIDKVSVISLFCSDPDDVAAGKARIDCLIDVHGGLTFADRCRESSDPARGICHIPAEGDPDNVWWFGFDCAHSGDHSPGYERKFRSYGIAGHGGDYRDVEYVKSEIHSLARQLAAIGAPPSLNPSAKE